MKIRSPLFRIVTFFVLAAIAVPYEIAARPTSPMPSFTPRHSESQSVRKFKIPEHDLFPESIAYDPVSGDFFLSSMSRARILRIHPDGSYEDFLTVPVPALESSVGIKIDPHRQALWVCSGRFRLYANPSPAPPQTGFLWFDLKNGAPLGSWSLQQESPFHICNDVELTTDGTAFITTTLLGRVYRANPATGEVSLVHQLDEGEHNNGLTLGPEERHLFIVVNRGIRRYDLANGTVLNIELPREVGAGPDGLYYHNGSLIMIQPRSSQVVQLTLNHSHTEVEHFKVLAREHPDFAYPTTGVVVDDSLVFVASSYADVPRSGSSGAQHGDVFIHEVPIRE